MSATFFCSFIAFERSGVPFLSANTDFSGELLLQGKSLREMTGTPIEVADWLDAQTFSPRMTPSSLRSSRSRCARC